MSKPIPDRWIPYKACGKVIEGTRIICFKVPLRKAVQIGKPEIKEIWDVKTLLETIPNLGAVIDLTNTSRYYDPRELQAAGILHRKILMPGRIIPPEKKVQQFMDIVDEFLGKDCEFLVGVHCTHGLNRTGYMVCRYMRDRLNIPAKTALKRFEIARGYQIEREIYVAGILDCRAAVQSDGVEKITERTRKNGETRENTETSAENWRTEPRSSADRSEGSSFSWNNRRSEGEGFNWNNRRREEENFNRNKQTSEGGSLNCNKKHNKGEYSNAWKRAKTYSERSFDFKYQRD